MDKKLKTFSATSQTIAIVFLVLAGGFCLYFLYIFSNSPDAIKAAIMSGAVALFAAIYTQQRSRTREIESRHFNEKSEAYRKLINLIFEYVIAAKEGQNIDPNSKEAIKKLLEIKKEFLIWASPETLMAFSSLGNIENDGNMFKIVNSLLGSMRKDLGHKDTNLPSNFYVKYFLIEQDRSKVDGVINDKNKDALI